MKYQQILKWFLPVIILLAGFSAAMGLFLDSPGEPFSFTNHRGETVLINNHGLYRYDTVSSTAQMQGNDLVTLVVGIPVLILSAFYAFRGSLRGRLLLTGTVGFFLYTYMSMSMLTSFNQFFLLYVVIFSTSLFSFILCMMSFDLSNLANHFSSKLPRKAFAIFFFLVCLFLMLAWIGRILSPVLQNSNPFLEITTTMVIQAMDLGLVVPLAFLSGFLLLRNSGWGYLLTSVLVMKAITMGLAVSTMVINMMRMGTSESPAVMYPFLVITIVNIVFAFILSKHITKPNLIQG
jgi:hypothetical protein